MLAARRAARLEQGRDEDKGDDDDEGELYGTGRRTTMSQYPLHTQEYPSNTSSRGYRGPASQSEETRRTLSPKQAQELSDRLYETSMRMLERQR